VPWPLVDVRARVAAIGRVEDVIESALKKRCK
jgi:hypothetical protein